MRYFECFACFFYSDLLKSQANHCCPSFFKEIERDLLAVALKKRVIELSKTGVIHSFGINGGKTMKNCKKHIRFLIGLLVFRERFAQIMSKSMMSLY